METSRIFHDSFAFSTAAQRLRKLTMVVVCKWKKSLKIWSKSIKQHVDLLKRPMFSKIAVLVLLTTVFLLMNLEYLCSMSLNTEIKYCRKPKKMAYLRTCLVTLVSTSKIALLGSFRSRTFAVVRNTRKYMYISIHICTNTTLYFIIYIHIIQQNLTYCAISKVISSIIFMICFERLASFNSLSRRFFSSTLPWFRCAFPYH